MAIKISGTTVIDDSKNLTNINSGEVSGISTASIWSNPSSITTSYELTGSSKNYGVFGPVSVSVGATITVGVGNTFVIV